jgi:hypothetical protein
MLHGNNLFWFDPKHHGNNLFWFDPKHILRPQAYPKHTPSITEDSKTVVDACRAEPTT